MSQPHFVNQVCMSHQPVTNLRDDVSLKTVRWIKRRLKAGKTLWFALDENNEVIVHECIEPPDPSATNP